MHLRLTFSFKACEKFTPISPSPAYILLYTSTWLYIFSCLRMIKIRIKCNIHKIFSLHVGSLLLFMFYLWCHGFKQLHWLAWGSSSALDHLTCDSKPSVISLNNGAFFSNKLIHQVVTWLKYFHNKLTSLVSKWGCLKHDI